MVSRMHELIAALARLPLLFQDAVHGAGRAEILAFVQQGGLHGRRRAVLESIFMEDQQHRGALVLTEGASRIWPLRRDRRLRPRRRTRAQERTVPIEGS